LKNISVHSFFTILVLDSRNEAESKLIRRILNTRNCSNEKKKILK
jgi:hypothetical protein